MEVLDVCCPLQVPLVLYLSLGFDKDQRILMVCMQNSLLAKEIVYHLLSA
jgi:hypothetical protein